MAQQMQETGNAPAFTVPPHPSEANSTPKRPSPWRRRICCGVITLGVITAGVVGITVSLTGSADPTQIFVQEDPPGLKETNRWTAAKGRGLDITVLNACEDRWTPIFDEYITAWDNGSPDALTITSRRVAYDPECYEANGVAKVCNGNYGDTLWRGINTAFIRGGYVQHSVAKLNDYHLDRESKNQARYTMCHELGHAFGLPHTDENYYNWDRGDCMDYTIRPGNNLNPGEFNFNLLYSLYGSVDGDPSTSAAGTTKEANDRRRLGAPDVEEEQDETPDSVMEKYTAVRSCLEEMSCSECMDQAFFDFDGKMIHENSRGEACEFNLGEGYTIQTHKMLVR